MRNLLGLVVIVLTVGCAGGYVSGRDPSFPAHPDPSIANEQRKAPQPEPFLSLRDDHTIAFGDVLHEHLDARRAERIPHPMSVTATVPADVLDRLDASN
jgi:hypothetical protein